MELPVRPPRKFLPDNLSIDSWEKIAPYFKNLEERTIGTFADFWQWLIDKSELEAVLEEDMAWRYISMSRNTRDKDALESYHFFVEKIDPKIAPFADKFDKKLLSVDFQESQSQEGLGIIRKKADNHVRVFCEQNIPLLTKIQTKAQEFGAISAEMVVEFEGKKITLPQAAALLRETDRPKRERVYHLMQLRRMKDKDKLNNLYSDLIDLRNTVAVNAGFPNFRDYKFVDLSRVDYAKEDCFAFHDAVAAEIVPLLGLFDEDRKRKLGLESLKPWDTQVDVDGRPPLTPFQSSDELIAKTVECFTSIDPFFGDCINTMSRMKYLDLDSREGKAPGGFNYPLYEIGVPFIYMNSAGTIRDLVTMVHEGGHAVHSFLSRQLSLTGFKDLPSEVAELASMSMELISMEHWQLFFKDEASYNRAKKEQLQQVIDTLPWVAQIDKFQHWIYEHPSHTIAERDTCWEALMAQFGSPIMDWSALENERKNLWQKQLHLFEVPFYYIEYGMAQLGAISMWKNYKEDPKQAIRQYKEALSLGYTKPIGEIYKTAGISFKFNRQYVGELAAFVKKELDSIS